MNRDGAVVGQPSRLSSRASRPRRILGRDAPAAGGTPAPLPRGSWVASRANWPRIGTMNRWLDAPISRSAQSVRASSRRGAGYLYSEVSDPVAAEVEETLALTPALSPRRGGSTHSSRDFSLALRWHCFTRTYVGCYSFDGLVTSPGRRTVQTDDSSPRSEERSVGRGSR